MQWNAMELQWKSESVGHRARGIFCKSRCFENENQKVGKTVDRPFMSISNLIWLSRLIQKDCLGSGGFGAVYRGYLSSREAKTGSLR